MKQKINLILRIIGISTLVFGFIGFAICGFAFTMSGGKGLSPLVFFVVFFIGMILTAIPSIISASERFGQFRNIENTISNNIKEQLDTEKQHKQYICEYCGCDIKSDFKKCPNCGANKKSK